MHEGHMRMFKKTISSACAVSKKKIYVINLFLLSSSYKTTCKNTPYDVVVFHKMRNFVVFLFLPFLISVVLASELHLDANGAFGKYHSINELGVLFECNYTAYVSPSNADQVILNVSKTIYSTNDQINVTWTSHPTPCTDDFIGIYPTDSPLASGRNMLIISQI